MTHQYLQKIVK